MRLYLKSIKDRVERAMIDDLAYIGKTLCDTTAQKQLEMGKREKGDRSSPHAGGRPMNETYNLHDSLGWGVYLNGNLVNTKYGTADKVASELKLIYDNGTKKYVSGASQIKKFLTNYKPRRNMELIIAAAMPYAKYLEDFYLYTVISNVTMDMSRMVRRVFKKSDKLGGRISDRVAGSVKLISAGSRNK